MTATGDAVVHAEEWLFKIDSVLGVGMRVTYRSTKKLPIKSNSHDSP